MTGREPFFPIIKNLMGGQLTKGQTSFTIGALGEFGNLENRLDEHDRLIGGNQGRIKDLWTRDAFRGNQISDNRSKIGKVDFDIASVANRVASLERQKVIPGGGGAGLSGSQSSSLDWLTGNRTNLNNLLSSWLDNNRSFGLDQSAVDDRVFFNINSPAGRSAILSIVGTNFYTKSQIDQLLGQLAIDKDGIASIASAQSALNSRVSNLETARTDLTKCLNGKMVAIASNASSMTKNFQMAKAQAANLAMDMRNLVKDLKERHTGMQKIYNAANDLKETPPVSAKTAAKAVAERARDEIRNMINNLNSRFENMAGRFDQLRNELAGIGAGMTDINTKISGSCRITGEQIL